VRLEDRVIVSGNTSISISLDEEYLREIILNDKGEVVSHIVHPNRVKGIIQRKVRLDPKWIYVAVASKFYERNLTFMEKVRYQFAGLIQKTIGVEQPHIPANVLLLYDPKATGGAYNDQLSLAAAFLALNIPLERFAVTPKTEIKFSGYNCILVPYNVADMLSDAQIESLKLYVQQGGNLITDFQNILAAELGIRFLNTSIQIDRVRDTLFPDEPLKWHRSEVMNKFEIMRYDEIMSIDDKTEIPVVIGRKYGDGKFIFLGTRFDPVSTGGFSRYPYLIHHVEHFFSLYPLVRRDQLEMYFDPGFRHTVSVEQLVSRWTSNGIRVIHVAGWHEYPKYKYDYARLIRLAHSNGMLVYAWLEPPQVSQKFWLDHPQWREKNYRGEDVRPSWRYPVALTDPACLNATLAYYRKFLESYDWDGVNIAELYFEAGRGIKDPKLMTPMHLSARREFRRLYGFDPKELFDPNSLHYWENDPDGLSNFIAYRVKTITRLHDIILSMADSFRRKKPGFQIILTVIDNLSAPELRSKHGVDVNKIIPLKAKYPFLLQIEDPETMWSLDPRRYESIANRYTELTSSKNFALDLNILSFRSDSSVTPFPTKIQTGTECYQLVNAAARGAERVTIYCESSINPQDLAHIPYAYSSRTAIKKVDEGWTIVTPTPVVLQLSPETREITLNKKRIFTIGNGRFLLPIGSYYIQTVPRSFTPFQSDILKTRIRSITGDLLSEESSQRSVKFRYRSQNRCIVTLVKEPFALFIDGQETRFKALKGNGRYSLILPNGEHEVLLVAQSGMSYGVDITSLWSSSIIVIFGIISGGMLILFYGFVRVRHRSSLE